MLVMAIVVAVVAVKVVVVVDVTVENNVVEVAGVVDVVVPVA